MKKIIVAIPHSHTWFWTQTCVASLMRCPPKAEGFDVRTVIIDNSPWSPAIRGVSDTRLGEVVDVIGNYKSNKFHASALDCVVESLDFDYLMALETDVMALMPDWLQWFVDQMGDNDYAVGHWHHEQFVNPSCTLYRGDVLRSMLMWCQDKGEPDLLRWGPEFRTSQPVADRQPERDYRGWYDDNIRWLVGPFAEKRGWSEGEVLKETPSGQMKGPGWYEPGQQLHHWAVEAGYTYTVCPSLTTTVEDVPVQTMYGEWGDKEYAEVSRLVEGRPQARMGCGDKGFDHRRQLEAVEMFGNAYTVHLWGGTRALDILKHDVTCQFVKSHTPYWLAREARFWREVVPADVREDTLDLIRRYGWHTKGQGTDHVTDRDRAAAEYVKQCYEAGGVTY